MTEQEEIREIQQGLKEIHEGKIVPLSLIEKRQEIREVIDGYKADGLSYEETLRELDILGVVISNGGTCVVGDLVVAPLIEEDKDATKEG